MPSLPDPDAKPPRKRRPLDPPTVRLLSREEAAAYTGVSVSTFNLLVAERFMPAPHRLRGRVLWDLWALDRAIDALPENAEPTAANPWDQSPTQ
jgi:predicted DNA-binding transcriptional regulator AlpA